jgi:hypothetical protein
MDTSEAEAERKRLSALDARARAKLKERNKKKAESLAKRNAAKMFKEQAAADAKAGKNISISTVVDMHGVHAAQPNGLVIFTPSCVCTGLGCTQCDARTVATPIHGRYEMELVHVPDQGAMKKREWMAMNTWVFDLTFVAEDVCTPGCTRPHPNQTRGEKKQKVAFKPTQFRLDEKHYTTSI